MKEWAIATRDITSVTQLPRKGPVVLRPILSNSLPLSVIFFSGLERLLLNDYEKSRALPAMSKCIVGHFYYSRQVIFVNHYAVENDRHTV